MRGRRLWGAVSAIAVAASLTAVDATPSVATESPGFVLGTMLPDTGVLDSYGPATQLAVRLAVDDAREAGAVVRLVPGDSGDGIATVSATVARLRGQGVTAVIGPMSSRLLLDALPSLSGLAVVSPATSSPLLTGRITRTSPSDALQGAALAKLAAQSRVVRLAIVVPRDSSALADAAVAEATARGMQTSVITFGRTTSAGKIAARVSAVVADGLLLASAAETTPIVRELLRRGLPATVLLTATAGAGVDAKALPRQTLAGARVLGPDLRVPGELRQRLGALKKLDYAAQAYDAAAIAILAAEQVASTGAAPTGPLVSAALPNVTTGGTACQLADCLRLIGQGRDIDYHGLSGEVDLDADGDPVVATYAVRTLGAANTPAGPVSYVRVP